MTTAFSSISAAIEAVLKADPPLAQLVTRAKSRRVPEETDTAINVQFETGDPSPGAISGAPVDWTSTFAVECYARGTDSGDVLVDPLLEGAYARIMADTTLGGLVQDIRPPALEMEYDAQEKKTGWVRMLFPIFHRTSNLSLASP